MSDANVFISHHHGDAGIADALSDAIKELFRGRVSVSYSTKNAEGGVPAGANWFDWIGREAGRSQVTVVLLTQRFIARPSWLLWEMGAVYGTALAGGGQGLRVRPLRYRIEGDQLPGPLRAANLQMARGDSAVEVQRFLAQLIGEFDVLGRLEVLEAGASLKSVVSAYIQRIEDCLKASALARPGAPARNPAVLNKTLDMVIRAMQAFAPAVMMNGRYFYAAVESGREVLVRDENVYCETIKMPEEFGLSRLDVERDAGTIVICQSYLRRTPIYRVLGAELMEAYSEEIRGHISPEQGWVLGCPVLMSDGKPWGVICLYGTTPPAQSTDDERRLKDIGVHLSEAFGRALSGPES